MPLLDLVYQAASVHRLYHDPRSVRPRTWRWRSYLSDVTGSALHSIEYQERWMPRRLPLLFTKLKVQSHDWDQSRTAHEH